MKNKSKNVTLIHKKKKFVFRKVQESDEAFVIETFGSLEEFQKIINPDTEFNKFAESIVRMMHHFLITEMSFEDFKNFFWKTQEDIAALYYKFGPCMGTTPKMQRAANRESDQKDKIRELQKKNRALKYELAKEKTKNFVFGR